MPGTRKMMHRQKMSRNRRRNETSDTRLNSISMSVQVEHESGRRWAKPKVSEVMAAVPHLGRKREHDSEEIQSASAAPQYHDNDLSELSTINMTSRHHHYFSIHTQTWLLVHFPHFLFLFLVDLDVRAVADFAGREREREKEPPTNPMDGAEKQAHRVHQRRALCISEPAVHERHQRGPEFRDEQEMIKARAKKREVSSRLGVSID